MVVFSKMYKCKGLWQQDVNAQWVFHVRGQKVFFQCPVDFKFKIWSTFSLFLDFFLVFLKWDKMFH